jgi:glycosyltransferase involved in cell wall biosynthesis
MYSGGTEIRMPELSFIMPAKNVGPYIREAVLNVSHQSF